MKLGVGLVTVKSLLILGICVAGLSACQHTAVQRSTLADLANEQIAQEQEYSSTGDESTLMMNKSERSAKLASLYQEILTVEPNAEVRAKIEYRLVQIGTQAYEQQAEGLEYNGNSAQSLTELVASYQALLARFPNREENEAIHYQLAKALNLQGNLADSLVQIELLLSKYPESKYAAELHFKRGDIYYNLQHYTKALMAYQAVLGSKNSAHYYINSVYMTGWTLFKLNRLPEADETFLTLLDFIVAQEKVQAYEDSFSFTSIDSRYVSLVDDIQRVLSISLSQQQQAKSLVALLETYQQKQQKKHYLYLYRHVLFKNLADFLLENGLKYDAELTYQAYLTLAPNTIWAARYSLSLLDLYQQQGKYQAIRALKVQYVQQYGLQSKFWQQGSKASHASIVNETLLQEEILPNLLAFSYQHSRYLYAKAQSETSASAKIKAFANTSHWLGIYLSLAKRPQSTQLISKLTLSDGLLADEMLYADASFAALHYQQALTSYEYIAYQAPSTLPHSSQLRIEAAYATTLTIRELLSLSEKDKMLNENTKQNLVLARDRFDQKFIEQYPNDERSLTLAVWQAQYAFANGNDTMLQYYSTYILQTHGVIARTDGNSAAVTKVINHSDIVKKLSKKARKEVQIASQLQANYLYQQGQYQEAEASYSLALHYVDMKSQLWQKMRELLAASIYFQGQRFALSQPLLAVKHYLRLGEQVPESSYRLSAHFDAANLLLAQAQWQEAIDVMLVFQKRYPKHEYSHAMSAKLATAYEHLQQWQKAATQYLAIVTLAEEEGGLADLKREALYSAAALYLKANNIAKAISTFRKYVHAYPKPFDIAQEVRFKMSGFYQQTKEPNKQYYWYRQMIKYHEQHFSQATKKPNSRALYLASVAALGLGEAHQQTFKQLKLTLPLNKSLTRKQQAMTLAIGYYKKLLSFNLAEFVPRGTFNLAQMYRQLTRDVMASQRPKDLDALALEEYNLLLEEMVYPFEEKAIAIHSRNAQRAWQNIYDPWVKKSFAALAVLEPALYDRHYRSITNQKERDINAVRTLH